MSKGVISRSRLLILAPIDVLVSVAVEAVFIALAPFKVQLPLAVSKWPQKCPENVLNRKKSIPV